MTKTTCYYEDKTGYGIFAGISPILFFIVAFTFSVANAQTVTGIVTDEESKPVSGATVAVKGTAMATATNSAGNFIFNAKSTYVLVITYV